MTSQEATLVEYLGLLPPGHQARVQFRLILDDRARLLELERQINAVPQQKETPETLMELVHGPARMGVRNLVLKHAITWRARERYFSKVERMAKLLDGVEPFLYHCGYESGYPRVLDFPVIARRLHEKVETALRRLAEGD